MPASLMRSDELFAVWAKGQFKPVYIFTGQEDFLIEEAVHRILSHRLPDAAGSINHDRLDAEDLSVGEIVQTAQTMPFGADVRVVEVRNTGRLSAEDQKNLAEALPRLPETTQLILIWGKEWRKDDAERPLVRAAQGAGAAVIFWPLFPENAQRWVMQRAKHYQKTIAGDAAAWMVQEVGESLRRLDQELYKAAVYIGDRPQITKDDLEMSFGYQKALSPYEWLDALRQRRSSESMQALRQLLEEDEEPLKLLAMATYSVRDWLKEGDSREEGLTACVEAHQSIKSGKETPPMALTLLTLRLCGLHAMDARG
jgi:DNA polymerase-3 subunit delta